MLRKPMKELKAMGGVIYSGTIEGFAVYLKGLKEGKVVNLAWYRLHGRRQKKSGSGSSCKR